MDTVSLLKASIEGAHQILEGTMADVTQEQADWSPPGKAHSLGANYAHTIFSEDMMVNGMLKGAAPLAMTTFAGKAGVSELPPMPDQGDWDEWASRVTVDLSAARRYAQAVDANTTDYLSSLGSSDLERSLDLSNFDLGQQSLAWVLSNIVIWHANAHCGEASCLKGLQGAKGYPF